MLDKDYSLFSLATDLQFPYSIKTYEAMASDTTLASALNAVQTVALRVPRFIEPYNETTRHDSVVGQTTYHRQATPHILRTCRTGFSNHNAFSTSS